jgi:hypothetical protein
MLNDKGGSRFHGDPEKIGKCCIKPRVHQYFARADNSIFNGSSLFVETEARDVE